MPHYEYRNNMLSQPLYVGDFMKAFFKSQGIKPYLPLKNEIVKNIQQPDYKGKYRIWNYAMPYHIEIEHLRKYREEIRSMPVNFFWNESELKEYEALPNEDLKRRMILDKVDMKSLYLPDIKYEKDFIDFPSLPADEKSKDNFAKGLSLYNKGKQEFIEASIPYFESSALAGNYISHEILSRYYLEKMKSYEKMEDILWERANKNFIIHCQWLQKANLPAGYYLMSEYHIYYADINKSKLSNKDMQIIYNERVYPNMIKALKLGSYDLMWKLAVYNRDIEWAFTCMLLTGNTKAIDSMINNLNNREDIPASPRNIAIMKLAVMLGSHSAFEIFLGKGVKSAYVFNNLSCLFYHDPLIEYNNIWLESCHSLYSTREKCNNILKEKSFLIPDIDNYIQPSTVLFSPYANFDDFFSLTEGEYRKVIEKTGYYDYKDKNLFPKDKIWSVYKEFPYKDPRSKYSTLEHKIFYKKLLEESDADNALDDNDILSPEDKYFAEEKIEELAKRLDNYTLMENEVLEFFGYLNTLKKLELEMNPYYYKLARPYIFPVEIYQKYPHWY